MPPPIPLLPRRHYGIHPPTLRPDLTIAHHKPNILIPYSQRHLQQQELQKLYSKNTQQKTVPRVAKYLFMNKEMNTTKKAGNHYVAADYAYARCEALGEERKRFFYKDPCNFEKIFRSWFAITDLHVWMVGNRLRVLGADKKIQQEILNLFINDIETRLYELGYQRDKEMKKNVTTLMAIHYGTNLAYDEGLEESDGDLASALWRNLFDMRKDVTCTTLEKVVEYVRKHTHLLLNDKTIAGDVWFDDNVAHYQQEADQQLSALGY